MVSMPQSRHRIAIVLKSKTQPFVQETHHPEKTNTGLESKAGKKFSKQMDHINRQK
jgi:hypothetical protein